tara:strand:+ start:58 stop:558 length:501 start_codon:yes stop_codon:yes gene_type:complete
MQNDRELQNQILSRLKEAYPGPVMSRSLAERMQVDHHHLCCNLAYLREHDLVSGEIRITSDGSKTLAPCQMKITAKGIDFIEEDGGLSAVLGLVTVKLHADTIRGLILAQVEASDAETSVKTQIKATVQNLPAKGLEAVVTRLAQEGLTRLPNAMQWLQTTISGAL